MISYHGAQCRIFVMFGRRTVQSGAMVCAYFCETCDTFATFDKIQTFKSRLQFLPEIRNVNYVFNFRPRMTHIWFPTTSSEQLIKHEEMFRMGHKLYRLDGKASVRFTPEVVNQAHPSNMTEKFPWNSVRHVRITNLWLVDSSTRANWKSPFPIQRVSG